MRYELTDFEWAAIRSFLSNKPRSIPRVDDRRILNGIFWGHRQLKQTRSSREHLICCRRIRRWRLSSRSRAKLQRPAHAKRGESQQW